MPKIRSFFTCQKCEYQSQQWLGKCPQCSAWNSFVEGQSVAKPSAKASPALLSYNASLKPISLDQVNSIDHQRTSTGISEFDRALGGGIVPGAVTLIGGEPGIGKSTILLQVALKLAEQHQVWYVSGEESPEQIKMRAERILSNPKNLIIYPQPNINDVLTQLKNQKLSGLRFLIIDSIQTVYVEDVDSPTGTVTQIKESTAQLVRFAKETSTPVIIIGHVTKDGALAGPKVLEHLVDTVLYFEGERHQDLRIIRAVKNRFGAASEIGVFEMTQEGLKEVSNPSRLFLEERVQAPGSVSTIIMEGARPIMLEVQALVTKSFIPVPRRAAQGIDNNRLQMLVAVLQKRLNVPLYEQDIFVNAVGGIKIEEPSADLAISLAIFSSLKNIEIPQNISVIGEVGLQGEVRNVTKLQRRIEEASKLGFKTIYAPPEIKSIQQATSKIFK